MSSENLPVLSINTWARSIEPVKKIGYMDGASAGQTSAYQKSFDIGYKQGFNFGLHLGIQAARMRMKGKSNILNELLMDTRKINCQICINKNDENVANLYNNQRESNLAILG